MAIKKDLHPIRSRSFLPQILRLTDRLQLRVVLGHLRAIKGLEGALVAGAAVDFCDITLGAQP